MNHEYKYIHMVLFENILQLVKWRSRVCHKISIKRKLTTKKSRTKLGHNIWKIIRDFYAD